MTSFTTYSIQHQASYVAVKAARHQAIIVPLGPFILFSTNTGDAWMLDTEHGTARCLARNGNRLPDGITETHEGANVDWNSTFYVEGDSMIFTDQAGQRRSFDSYPIEELRRALAHRYEPLLRSLKALPQAEVVLTFQRIEATIGAPLPQSAFDREDWWGNQAGLFNRPQADAWRNAGFAVEVVHLDEHWARFRRIPDGAPVPVVSRTRVHRSAEIVNGRHYESRDSVISQVEERAAHLEHRLGAWTQGDRSTPDTTRASCSKCSRWVSVSPFARHDGNGWLVEGDALAGRCPYVIKSEREAAHAHARRTAERKAAEHGHRLDEWTWSFGHVRAECRACKRQVFVSEGTADGEALVEKCPHAGKAWIDWNKVGLRGAVAAVILASCALAGWIMAQSNVAVAVIVFPFAVGFFCWLAFVLGGSFQAAREVAQRRAKGPASYALWFLVAFVALVLLAFLIYILAPDVSLGGAPIGR